MRLRLSHKGLLLVGVILAFELLFVGMLVLLLRSAEGEARREEQAKEILNHTDKLTNLVYEGTQLLQQFADTRDMRVMARYGEVSAEMPVIIDWLKKNVPADQLDLINEIDHNLTTANRLVTKLSQLLPRASMSELVAIMTVAHDRLNPLLGQTTADFLKLRQRQENITLKGPERQRRMRHQLERVVYAGVATNVLGAIALVIFFMKGITSRLDVLTDNTRRLAASQPLNPLLSGTDEIAGLDRVFHEMAEALAEAERRREEIQQLKQRFMQMVSHDLRTPLTSIRAFLTIVKEGAYGELTAKGMERADGAERSAVRLLALVNDLLDVEKLESGMFEMEFKDIPIAQVVQRSLDSVRAVAEQKEIAIEAQDSKAFVHADGDRLVQVLVNLLSNAIKYSPPGSPVTISVTEAAGLVEVRVTDRGRGIPAHLRDAIFERFKQVEIKDAKEKGGTGLGLAIAKAMIEQHGGSIGVDSEEGKGSSFWFRVPASREPGAPLRDPGPALEAK